MNSYSPAWALILFFIFSVLIFLIFRPRNGWFWIIKNNWKTNKKTIIEDVLKHIYHCENSGKETTINGLTGALKFKDHLVIEVVNTMTINELIQLDVDVLKLTKKGRDYALKIVRVHRLWEKYLAEKTGYDKSEWHDRAELKEHELDHDEVNLLARQLGNPMFDPHGDPIPSNQGKIVQLKGEMLSSLPVDSVGRIIHIEDEPEVIYRQIIAQKIFIDSQIRIVENNTKRVVFHSEGEEFKLAPIVAGNITIALLEKEVIHKENTMRLSSIKEGEIAKIVGISKESRGDGRRRLLDLGFVKGTEISIDLKSPLQNPVAYSVKGTSIALRNDQASMILIKKEIENEG